MKKSTLRWFGHIERMENEEFIKKVYLSSIGSPNRRGRPLGRWEDRVKEHMSDRRVRGNGLEWPKGRVWIGRSGDLSWRNTSGGSEPSELLIHYLIEYFY